MKGSRMCWALGVAVVALAMIAPGAASAAAASGNAGALFHSEPVGKPRPSGLAPYPGPAGTASPWQALTHQPPIAPGSMLLQSNGTVLVHEDNTRTWYELIPDASGNYVDGTWKQLASLPSGYSPEYFASAVLPSGKTIVEGGEYNGSSTEVWTTKGAIYNPTTNTWTSVAPPSGWSYIGDAQSDVLSSGTFMLANCCTTQEALLNASTMTWSATGTGKADINDEEGWTLLPSGNLLTVDATDAPNTELYNASTGSWSTAGSTPSKLSDSAEELGPQVYSPNGTLLALGATPHSALYTYATGSWAAGPNMPVLSGTHYDAADAPASILPNGSILFDASPGDFNSPTHFYLYNGSSFSQIADAPNAPNVSSYETRMLVLPNGQVLYDDGTQMDVYSPSASAPSSWAPTITKVPTTLSPGSTYTLSGTQLAGLDQGAAYGDDFQDNTNYPLVRVTNNATGAVTYARTSNWSSVSIAPGKASQTKFALPAATPAGASTLVAVANGIASAPVAVTVK